MKSIAGKVILALSLAAAMLLGGCVQNTAVAPEKQDANTPVEMQPAETSGTGTAGVAETSQKTYAEAKQAAERMYPVLDSLVRAMGVGGGNPYAPADASFVWDVLYMTAENWTGRDARITTEGEWNDIAVVPGLVMREIAAAAFAGMTELPPMPADAVMLAYDAAGDVYRLQPSDTGDTDTKAEQISAEQDGSIRVILGLYAGAGERLGAICFTIAENASAAENALYPCCVTSAAEDAAPFAAWTEVRSGVAFTADLNDDGVEETITLTFPTGAEDMATPSVAISDGGVSYTDNGADGVYQARAFLTDILAGDGKKELIITGDAASDDYVTNVYRYENGAISRAYLFGAAAGAMGGGRLTVETWVNVLGTYGATCEYYMADDFSFVLESPYTIVRYDGDWQERCLTLQKDGLPVVKDYAETTTLPLGTELMLVSTDQASYANLVGSDGSTYSVAIEKKADDWQWYIGSVAESEWFGELMYAG